jgi:hypothetical protein
MRPALQKYIAEECGLDLPAVDIGGLGLQPAASEQIQAELGLPS